MLDLLDFEARMPEAPARDEDYEVWTTKSDPSALEDTIEEAIRDGTWRATMPPRARRYVTKMANDMKQALRAVQDEDGGTTVWELWAGVHRLTKLAGHA